MEEGLAFFPPAPVSLGLWGNLLQAGSEAHISGLGDCEVPSPAHRHTHTRTRVHTLTLGWKAVDLAFICRRKVLEVKALCVILVISFFFYLCD